MSQVWINGELRDARTAGVGVDDRGFLLGHAAFETLRVDAGVILRWPRHLARLRGGLDFLGIAAPDHLAGVEAAAAQLAQNAGLEAATARLTVTAGEGGGGLQGRAGEAATAVLTLGPRPTAPNAVSVKVLEAPRRGAMPAEAFKLSGYAGLIEARRCAQEAGFDRAVVTGPGGKLACADCANIYWITGQRVQTPALSCGALPGTARAALIEAARADGLEIEEVLAGPDALRQADAAFMTNAVEGVTAIANIGGVAMDVEHALLARLRALEARAD